MGKVGARALLRRYSPRFLYPTPRSSLQPERLYAYLDALWQRRDLEGAIVEVGCWLGGTSALAWKMLARTGYQHRYVAIDTFSGFVPEQFAHDERLGTPRSNRVTYNGSSPRLVRTLLDSWGAPGVELLQADIASLSNDRLPESIAVCLIDVDLEIPVLEGLRRISRGLSRGESSSSMIALMNQLLGMQLGSVLESATSDSSKNAVWRKSTSWTWASYRPKRDFWTARLYLPRAGHRTSSFGTATASRGSDGALVPRRQDRRRTGGTAPSWG